MSEAATSTPVTIITGFLGSGKTTLLNSLLGDPEMGETAVLINEFGEIGLDHLLVREISEDVVVLSSGCICCTVQGELVDSLRDLFIRRLAREIPDFTRVVIETTGLADPAPIIGTLVRDPLFKDCYRLDGIVTTVDAAHGEGQLDSHMEAVKQAAIADRIVLTKSDIAQAETIDALQARLRNLNPAAPILAAEHGNIAPDALLNAGLFDALTKTPQVQDWLNEDAYPGDGHDHDHGHNHRPNVNRHDDHISSFCLTLDVPLQWNRFRPWLGRLLQAEGEKLLRIKGILNVEGKDAPQVLHCVQHTYYPPVALPAWPGDDHRSRLVFITRDLGRDEIEADLQKLQETR